MSYCPICSNSARVSTSGFDDNHVTCNRCGIYFITSDAKHEIREADLTKLSVLLMERNLKNLSPLAIFSEQPTIELHPNYRKALLRDLLSSFPSSISERLNRSLINLSHRTNYPGASVNITEEDKHIFFTQSGRTEEVFFVMSQLVNEDLIIGNVGFPASLSITVRGWNAIADLEKEKDESNQAFIAMWFNEEMNSASVNIQRAITDAGYNPIRIDQVDHNNKIDDEIVAEIQRSKFVVADFSGHRGGVYFEAGYAMGLGIPVIWTCRHDHLADLHFDTRQYSHIVWEQEEELYTKLFNRIRATIH